MEICDAHNDFLTAVKEKQKRAEIVDNFVLSGVKILKMKLTFITKNIIPQQGLKIMKIF